MAYAFAAREALDVAVRRVATEELDDAIANLHGSDDTRDERIHELRKSLKKLRALLRLIRGELGAAQFRRENECLRDLGRHLSGARDAAAVLGSFDALLSHYRLAPADFSWFRERLLEQRARAASLGPEAAASEVDHGLRLAHTRIADWRLEASWDGISRGLARTYVAGRRAFHQAYRDGTPEAFHEWRKRVKDHMYHVRLIGEIWPEPMKALRSALDELSELLGDDHDLVELARLVTADDGASNAAQRTDLLSFIGDRQNELRARARPIGQRVYAEKPRRLRARFDAYYDAHRAEGASIPPIAAR